jgi:hypothetical protein
MPKKSKEQPTVKDTEQLGKMLVNIYESGYLDKNQSYKMSFIKGVFGGFGGVVGATLVVALLIWILSLLSNVSLVEKVVTPINDTIKQSQQK